MKVKTKMALFLLVETSNQKGSMGLCELSDQTLSQAKFLAFKQWPDFTHSQFITEAFQNLLKESNKTFSDLSGVVVSTGPGRFTSLRVGIAFAKTLAFTLKVAVYPLSSLRILAEPEVKKTTQPVLALLNAFKNSLFAAVYQKESQTGEVKTLLPPRVVTPDKLSCLLSIPPYRCVGEGYKVYENQLSREVKQKLILKSNDFPSARHMAGVFHTKTVSSVHWKKLQPVYLRSPVT